MSQHEPTHTRSAIIADLGCIVGEMAELQCAQARLAEQQAAMQARLGKLIRDLATTTALSPAQQRAQQFGPAIAAFNESADQAKARLRPSEPPKGAAADPVLKDPEPPIAPRVDAPPPKVVAPGNVQDGGPSSTGDRVMDLWATTLLTYDEIAAKLKINPNSPSSYVSIARSKSDPRAKQGDEPRERIRQDAVLKLYAERPLTLMQIDREIRAKTGTAARVVDAAREAQDERVNRGDVLRAPKTPPAEPRRRSVADLVKDAPTIPDGQIIVADVKDSRITGPRGSWSAVPFVVKALALLADGNLYGTDRMARAANMDEKALVGCLPLWSSGLRGIGVELVHTKGIGCKLNRAAGLV